MEEDRDDGSPLVVHPEPTPGRSGVGSALVLLFLFFGMVGFGIFGLVFLALGFRDSRDALLCNSLCVGSLGVAGGCVASFWLVIARTQRGRARGALRPTRLKS